MKYFDRLPVSCFPPAAKISRAARQAAWSDTRTQGSDIPVARSAFTYKFTSLVLFEAQDFSFLWSFAEQERPWKTMT